ncbi:MAG: hypothetical protein ACXADX_09055 [Candidatus Hodarchaeales archaeon]|jgi:hypothetical protein
MSATADTSFLVNMHILGLLDLLCEVLDRIIIPPSVWEESFELHAILAKLACLETVSLTEDEQQEAYRLHDIMSENYKGKHHGEIEALVVAAKRQIPLLLCDNFAPWYLQRIENRALSTVKITRGFYAVEKLLEANLVHSDIIRNLEGTYSKKVIERLRRQFSI